MYGTAQSVSGPINGIGGDLVDGSGTINPAALNHSAVVSSTALATAPDSTPRGVKRSRSPEQPGDSATGADHDDDHPRKRGRPPKTPRTSMGDQQQQQHTPTGSATQIRTPRMQSQTLPQPSALSPQQVSPPEKPTPTKSLVKALPMVRDHTTDQLNEGKDEYIPKEFDEAGEKKVDEMGYLQGGREYKCRTFTVPLRGRKLFMLATECARVLSYRDSYLLFNKNRSLHKIIASQIEKDDLIAQDILPYSYRSRQIAIVSARSMFRQFGSRVIVNGRRVRDDYWESKARKQGFTEEDLAGEKRPGAAKARDAAAAAAAAAAEAASASLLPTLPQGDVIYSNAFESMSPSMSMGAPGASASMAPLSMIHLATTTDDPRLRDYTSLPRARQELSGQPYQDRSQPSSFAEIINQASQTAEFNKLLTSQRNLRQKGLEEFYATPREVPVSSAAAAAHSQPDALADSHPAVSQTAPSPQLSSVGMISQTQPAGMLAAGAHQTPLMAAQGSFPQQTPPGPMAQSPIRGMPAGMRPDLMHQRNTNIAAANFAYAYPSQPQQPQQAVWGQSPIQPQPSPLSASGVQAVGMTQYAPQMHGQQQQSQQQQQMPSPMAHHAQHQHQPSQSPRNQHRPHPSQMPQSYQLHPQAAHQQQPQAQAHMAAMGYPGANMAAYPAMAARMMYPSPQGPGGQPYMGGIPGQQPGMTMGMAPGGGMPGWPSAPGGAMPQGHPQQGQSGSPLGGWSGY